MIRLSIDQQIELMDRDGLKPFSRLWLLGEYGRYLDADRLSNAYEDALSAIIEGSDEGMRSEILQAALERAPLIDRVTAELAAATLCDPLTAFALAMQLGQPAFIDDSATDEEVMKVDDRVGSDNDGTMTAVWVAPGITWYASGAIVAPMPDTALIAAVGRPLSEVISHCVLDRFDLTVTGVSQDVEGRPVLETNADRTPISIEQLAAIRTPLAPSVKETAR